MGSRTFLSILAVSCLAGCGLHNFESKTASDTHTTDVEADVGPYNSEFNATTVYASDFERCLAEYRGYVRSVAICAERMEATRPPDYAQTPYPYGYGYGSYYGGYSQGFYSGNGYCNWPGCMAR